MKNKVKLKRVTEYNGVEYKTTYKLPEEFEYSYQEALHCLKHHWMVGFNDYPMGIDFDYEKEDYIIKKEWISGLFDVAKDESLIDVIFVPYDDNSNYDLSKYWVDTMRESRIELFTKERFPNSKVDVFAIGIEDIQIQNIYCSVKNDIKIKCRLVTERNTPIYTQLGKIEK